MRIKKGTRIPVVRTAAALLFLAATLVFCQNSSAQINELRQGQTIPQQAAANTPFDRSGTGAVQQGSGGHLANFRNGTPSMSSETNPVAKPLDLSALVSKLAMSTVFVLCLCVAGLVAFKKLNLHGAMGSLKTGRVTGGDVPGLSVESTLHLGKNNLLQVVRVDGSRMVVASDSDGIKSVLQIGSVFSRELDRIDAGEVRRSENTDQHQTVPGSRSSVASRAPFANFGNFRVGTDGL